MCEDTWCEDTRCEDTRCEDTWCEGKEQGGRMKLPVQGEDCCVLQNDLVFREKHKVIYEHVQAYLKPKVLPKCMYISTKIDPNI
jgi:hypothetical protein